jgi:hypothetical protein
VNSQNGLLAANGTLIETPGSIYNRTANIQPRYLAMSADRREYAAASAYATPLTNSGIGGSRPNGLGFTFGDSWDRTQRGIMEFSLPVGQVDTINMAMRFSCENSFVAKALRLKTIFTTKGVQNQTGDDDANAHFDRVLRQLHLLNIFRQAVYMYYSIGLVPIVLPEPGQPLNWIQIWDPRAVRIERAYGKTFMYIVPDDRMNAAKNDRNGTKDVRNKAYWDAMPTKWRSQLMNPASMSSVNGMKVLTLAPDSYIVIENRYNAFDRTPNMFDGSPLYPYFEACETYRMLMAGDFATAFLMKNIIALVSVGDPKLEGKDLYIRPDAQVLQMLEGTFQNPNKAQWVYGDPTLNVRYITPDPNVLANGKFAECKEQLKNLLPGPFWASEGGASFADATVEMQQLEEEAVTCQNTFDDQFWPIVYERASEGKAVAKKHTKPPIYDRSALRDRVADLAAKGNLFNSGGLAIKSLMEAHGYDPDVETQRLRDQQPDVKAGIYKPSFEQKQGIVASTTYGINKPQAPPTKGQGGKGGRPNVPGGKPQAASGHARPPRPSERSS